MKATPEQMRAVLEQVWSAWWDDAPRTPRSKRRERETVMLDSPWWQAICAVGDIVEPGWRDADDENVLTFAGKVRLELRVTDDERRALATVEEQQ